MTAQPIDERGPRPAHQGPREDRRDGDAVQDAEIDERARKQDPAADARRERAGGDDADAPPEMGGRRAGAIGEHEAHADQRHERGDDQRAKAEPERIVLEIGGDDAVEAEVEREVIDEHQAERAAAQRVDARDARRAAGVAVAPAALALAAPGSCAAPPLAAHRSGTRQSMRQPSPSGVPIADSVRVELRLGRRAAASACNASATPSCARIAHSPRSARSPPSLVTRAGERVAVGRHASSAHRRDPAAPRCRRSATRAARQTTRASPRLEPGVQIEVVGRAR